MATAQSTDSPTWRPIPDWPAYEASTAGDVRRALPGINTYAGRLMHPNLGKVGYYRLKLSDQGEKHFFFVHRLIATAFLGPIPAGMLVHHKDGCKTNNALGNLAYVTRLGNAAHAVRDGLAPLGSRNGKYTHPERTPRGERNGNAKLTVETVTDIRRLTAQGVRTGLVAAQLGINRTTVQRVKSGRLWSHLT